MPLHAEADAPVPNSDQQTILLGMVPGMGMRASDFHTKGLIAAAEQRRWPVTVMVLDPGPEAYLDGSVEARLLDDVAAAKRARGASRVWLAGISLGCQGILRCVRRRPDLAEGLMLITPYLASTGLVAEVVRAGGLQRWTELNQKRDTPERALLAWLATASRAVLPAMLVGNATGDRFAATAALLAEVVPAERLISVSGAHDWASWVRLWELMLDRDPFGQPGAMRV